MNRSLYEYEKDIGYRFIPYLKSRINTGDGGYLIKTNGQGFRNDEDFEEQKKGKRILVFGDSFTAGDGVSNGKRFTDYLELNTGKQVYNLGLSGTGTDQQYLIYQKYGKGLEHDVVIITVLVENIRRVHSKFRFYYNKNHEMICYPKPYYDLKNGMLVLHHHPVPNTNHRYTELSDTDKEKVDKGGRFMGARNFLKKVGAKQLTQKLMKIQPFPEYNSSDSAPWILMKEILKKWCSEINKPVYLLTLPTYHYIEGLADSRPYQQRFSELQGEIDAHIIDPLPFFMGFDKEIRRQFRFEKDIHLSRLGHKTLGDFLVQQISEKLQQ